MHRRLAGHSHDTRTLRHLARVEVRTLLALLRRGTLDPGTVHRIRRRTKRVSAVSTLVRQAGGPRLRRATRALRTIRRALSDIRDVDVVLETLQRHTVASPGLLAQHDRLRLRRVLRDRRRDAAERLAGSGLAHLASLAERVRDDVRRWRVEGSVAALLAAVASARHRCRLALTRARHTRSESDYHELRKAISRLHLQLALVRLGADELDAGPILARANAQLGEDRNLSLLDRLLEDHRLTLASDLGPLRQTIARRRGQLRSAASRNARLACARVTRLLRDARRRAAR